MKKYLKSHEFMLKKSDTVIIPTFKRSFILYEKLGSFFSE